MCRSSCTWSTTKTHGEWHFFFQCNSRWSFVFFFVNFPFLSEPKDSIDFWTFFLLTYKRFRRLTHGSHNHHRFKNRFLLRIYNFFLSLTTRWLSQNILSTFLCVGVNIKKQNKSDVGGVELSVSVMTIIAPSCAVCSVLPPGHVKWNGSHR